MATRSVPSVSASPGQLSIVEIEVPDRDLTSVSASGVLSVVSGGGVPEDAYDVIAWGNSLVANVDVPNFDSLDGTPPDYDTEYTNGSVQATTDSVGTTTADRWPEKLAASLGRSSSNVNQGVGGETMAQIVDRVQAASSDLKLRTTIIWIANSSTDDASYVTTVLPEIDAAVAALGHTRYLLITPSRDGSVGGARAAIEAYCMSNYPTRTLLMFDYLCSLANATSPAFAGDVTDVAGGRIGRALRTDSQHLNARGALAVHNVCKLWVEAIEGGIPYVMEPYPDFSQPDDNITSGTVVATFRWFGIPTSWSIVSGDAGGLYSIASGVLTRSATPGTLTNTTLVVRATNAVGSHDLSVSMVPNISAAAMSTPILITAALSSAAPSTSAVRYGDLCAGTNISMWGTSLTDDRHSVPIAGTFKNLRVKLSAAPTPGTWTLRLMVNGSVVGSDMVITGSSTDEFFSGTVATVAAGDRVALRCTPSSTPTAAIMYLSVEFASDASEGPLFARASTLPTADATTTYFPMGCIKIGTTSEAGNAIPMPTAGVIDKFYVDLTAAPGSGVTRTYALMKNGSATGLTVALSGTGTGAGITLGNDVSNSVSYAAGDTISIREVISGGTATTATARFSFRWTPTIAGESVLFTHTTGNISTGNNYHNMNGVHASGNSTESVVYNIAPVSFTLKKARGKLAVAPGGATARTITARVAGSSSALVLAFGTGDTTKADTSNDVAVTGGDTLTWLSAATGSPAASAGYFSAVAYIPPA